MNPTSGLPPEHNIMISMLYTTIYFLAFKIGFILGSLQLDYLALSSLLLPLTWDARLLRF